MKATSGGVQLNINAELSGHIVKFALASWNTLSALVQGADGGQSGQEEKAEECREAKDEGQAAQHVETVEGYVDGLAGHALFLGQPMAAVQSNMVKTNWISLKFARMSLIMLTTSCNNSLSVLLIRPK